MRLKRTKKITDTRTTATKHVPQRTCVACRQVKAKRELIRLVHRADGNVEVDDSGKKAGRGVYLCRSWECWQNGLKGKPLERALGSRISQENREQLSQYASTHLKGAK